MNNEFAFKHQSHTSVPKSLVRILMEAVVFFVVVFVFVCLFACLFFFPLNTNITSRTDFCIVGLSETHLKDKPNDFYSLSVYNFIGRGKGGVCIYIDDKIKYILRTNYVLVKIFIMQFPTMKPALLKLNVIIQKTSWLGIEPIHNFMADIDPVEN